MYLGQDEGQCDTSTAVHDTCVGQCRSMIQYHHQKKKTISNIKSLLSDTKGISVQNCFLLKTKMKI